MSLKGMAESRRREGDQAVWLKCSKCVADWTQAWPRCIAPTARPEEARKSGCLEG